VCIVLRTIVQTAGVAIVEGDAVVFPMLMG